MKTEEIRNMDDGALLQHLEDNRKELFNLRFQIEMRKIKNHQRIPEVKRDIARILTVMRERDLIRIYGGEDVTPLEYTTPAASETATRRRGLLGRFGR